MRYTTSFSKSVLTCAAACFQTFSPSPAFANVTAMIETPPAVQYVSQTPPYTPDQNSVELYRLRLELARSDVTINTASEIASRSHHPRLQPQ